MVDTTVLSRQNLPAVSPDILLVRWGMGMAGAQSL